MIHLLIKQLNILLVELPKGTHPTTFDEFEATTILFYEREKDGFISYCSIPKGKYSYIAPFEAMSEEMFAPLVQSFACGCYCNYGKGTHTSYVLPSKSFLSAVEASGYYFSNPYGNCPTMETLVNINKSNDSNVATIDSLVKQWDTAQSRTFDPALTHVFNLNQKTNENLQTAIR